jgi:hypothetical protein
VAASFSVSGLVLLFIIRKQTGLLRDGAAAAGFVTGHRRVKGGRILLYEFRLPDGTQVKGRGGQSRTPPEIGSIVTVLYNPERPRSNAPYPLDAVRLDR